jgi:Ca2+-binding EF-hand superfamily protein
MKQPLIDESNDVSSAPKYIAAEAILVQFSKEELKTLNDQFSRFDTDGSGDIDSKELAVIMGMIGQQCTPAELAELMKEADSDGDGNVSYEEFLSLVLSSKKVMLFDWSPRFAVGKCLYLIATSVE